MVEITNPSAATLSGPPLVRAAWAHRWFLLVALIVAGGAAWQGARALLGPAIVVDRVARGALTETVVATGNVQTPYRVEIGSQITGTVQDVLVEEGQRVVKGQPLIRIEDSELKSAVVGAEGAVEQAEARKVKAKVKADKKSSKDKKDDAAEAEA